MGRRSGARRPARLRHRRLRRPRRDPDPGRNRRREERDAFGRGAAPVHRHRRAHRERPSGGVFDLRRAAWARPDRPRPVCATLLGRGPRSLRWRRNPLRQAVFRDQTRTRPCPAGPRCRREGPRSLGRRRRGLRSRPGTARGHPQPRSGLRAGRVGQPAYAHTGRPDPRRPHPCTAAQTGLAETQRRRRQPRARACTPGPGSRCWPKRTPTPVIIIC